MECGIVPDDSALICGIIEVAALVKELNPFTEGDKTMGKTSGNVDLILLASGKKQASPPAESWRSNPDVQGHVKRLPFNNSAEFCLWVMQLVVKAAEGPFKRGSVVVLNKRIINPKFCKFPAMIGFHEEAARISEDLRAEFVNIRQRCLDSLQGS